MRFCPDNIVSQSLNILQTTNLKLESTTPNLETSAPVLSSLFWRGRGGGFMPSELVPGSDSRTERCFGGGESIRRPFCLQSSVVKQFEFRLTPCTWGRMPVTPYQGSLNVVHKKHWATCAGASNNTGKDVMYISIYHLYIHIYIYICICISNLEYR